MDWKRGFRLLLFISLLQSGVEGKYPDVFLNEPPSSPYYVREGGEGPTLECSIAASYRGDEYEVSWFRYTRGMPRSLTRGSKLLEKIHFDLDHDISTGKHNLKIKNITRADTSGSYHCQVLHKEGLEFTTEGTEVVVLVPPGEPSIVSSPSESVSEGESISMKCSSTGGSPTPSFHWYFHNSSLVPAELHSQQIIGDRIDSTIHWHATPEDNGAYVTCAVSNLALENGEERKTKSGRLNVLYRPRVSVGPVSEYAVEVGQMVHLSCSADANPSQPSFQWTHLASAQHYASAEWPFVAERGINGTFECRARNTIGEGTAVMTLQVQYAPEVHVKERINPSEGESVVVECTVDAWPLVESIEWSGPNGFKSRGSTLSLPSITSEHSGNYTCTATNYLTLYGESGSAPRSGEATTLVDVKRRPGRGVITPWTLSVVIGGTIELNCDATDIGSPAAQFKWASPSSGGQYGIKEHTRPTLIIRNAQLADNGEYRCIPHNAIGEGEPGIARVIVIEPATIDRPMATERIYGEGEIDQELSCEARGYPSPHIEWMKDNVRLDDEQSWSVEKVDGHSSCSPTTFCSLTVTSTLRWKRPVQWTDKGNYSCVASNGAAEKSSSWTVARVTHGPVILNGRYPVESLAAADIGSTAVISCRVSARPEPSFEWIYDSKEISEGGRYSFQLNKELDKPDEYESVLYVSEMEQSDYGRYLCRSMNGKGEKAQVIIKLQPTSVPSVSTMVEKSSGGSNWMNIVWKGGFDGGLPQSFLLEYRMLNPFTESTSNAESMMVEVKNTTLRSLTKSVIDPSKGEAQTMYGSDQLMYNLTGLKPASTYYIRLRSQNKMGSSEFSQLLIVSTDDAVINEELLAPSHIEYISSEDVFSIQPSPPSGSCWLMYVSMSDVWRNVGCFIEKTASISESGGDAFKARFCTLSPDGKHVAMCSAESKILVSSMLHPPYRLALLVPIAVLSFLILLVFAFLIMCCRFKTPSQTLKVPIGTTSFGSQQRKRSNMSQRPHVSGPYSSATADNNNGSATDSGVFTLDSSQLDGPKSPSKMPPRSANLSSHESGVDVWQGSDEPYNGYQTEQFIAHHPYPPTHDNTIYFDGRKGRVDSSYEEEEEEEAYSGRVLREIIV